MKVILKADVKGVGTAGSVLDVADGHARNYLLPRGLAEEATSGNIAQLESRRAALRKREDKILSEAKSLAQTLESKAVTVHAKAGEQGKLFGAVTNAQIADAIRTAFQVEIDRHKIDLDEPIKTSGDHRASVKLAHGVAATVTIRVVTG